MVSMVIRGGAILWRKGYTANCVHGGSWNLGGRFRHAGTERQLHVQVGIALIRRRPSLTDYSFRRSKIFAYLTLDDSELMIYKPARYYAELYEQVL